MVGSLLDGRWNRSPHRFTRLAVRLSCLQVHDTGQVGFINEKKFCENSCSHEHQSFPNVNVVEQILDPHQVLLPNPSPSRGRPSGVYSVVSVERGSFVRNLLWFKSGSIFPSGTFLTSLVDTVSRAAERKDSLDRSTPSPKLLGTNSTAGLM